MIDLDAFVNAARKPWYCRTQGEEDILSQEYIKEMSLQMRQAEKDAARYRWLRCMAEVDGADGMMISILISDDWDAAIDEAMQCIK